MKILGISLGHDSSLSLIEDGNILQVFEAERYFRKKRFKLHCYSLEHAYVKSGYQYVNVVELEEVLKYLLPLWGAKYDCIAVQNQGRKDEFKNLLTLLNRLGVEYKDSINVNHHLAHASIAYYTSPFKKSLILSYDGMGNDGQTIFFSADNGEIKYLFNSPLKMGSCYNNLGYLLGIKPEVCGTTSGKTMGLTAYGNIKNEWIPLIRKHIETYEKIPMKKIEGINSFGAAHNINCRYLNRIKELPIYRNVVERTREKIIGIASGSNRGCLGINDIKSKMSQDLAKTFQHTWTNIISKLLEDIFTDYDSNNLCVTGGCALNGIANYVLGGKPSVKKMHLIPNPSDCGLSAGSALYAYWIKTNREFRGNDKYFNPYLGMPLFDSFNTININNNIKYIKIDKRKIDYIIARLLIDDYIVGLIDGQCEVGPRALGNRSILCNPLNVNMRKILNEKVKNREWYRPFAPIVIEENSNKYFTNKYPIPYMSVICYVLDKYKSKLPSITHVDGSARVQTINVHQNEKMYNILKYFEELSGHSVLLNTSFNPAGEPILNYLKVAIDMLEDTYLDLVCCEDRIYWNEKRNKKLNEILKKLL